MLKRYELCYYEFDLRLAPVILVVGFCYNGSVKVNLCKPVPGGMTEQEKAEAGLLHNSNNTDEMKAFRFTVQDAICEYNKFNPSQVQVRLTTGVRWRCA